MGVVVCWAGGGALADVEQLPIDMIVQPQLSSDDEQVIETFVSEQFERLRSGEAAEVEEGRRSLESPFLEREWPSIAFRLTFGARVTLELRQMLRGAEGVQTLVNGLLVAGRCGTPQTVDLLGEVVLDARQIVSVRAAAAAGLEGVVRDAQDGRVRQDQGERAVERLGEALGGAEDPGFAAACMFGLSATERGELHAKGVEAVADALPRLTSRLRNAPGLEQVERWERTLHLGLRLMYVQQALPGGGPDRALTRSAVVAGGHVLSFVATRFGEVGASELSEQGEGEGGLLGAVAHQADQLIVIAGRSLSGAAARQTTLRDAYDRALERGDDEAFTDAVEDVLSWIGRATGTDRDEFDR